MRGCNTIATDSTFILGVLEDFLHFFARSVDKAPVGFSLQGQIETKICRTKCTGKSQGLREQQDIVSDVFSSLFSIQTCFIFIYFRRRRECTLAAFSSHGSASFLTSGGPNASIVIMDKQRVHFAQDLRVVR